MIKQLIKKFCFKIYSIGKFEEARITNKSNLEKLHREATIAASVYISVESNIYNQRKDKSLIKVNEGSRIMGDLLTFDHGGQITIGRDCFVGPLTRIWSAGRITIGDRVLIAHNVNIHDNISHPLDAKLRHEEFIKFAQTGVHEQVDLKPNDINIEDDVWIGFNSIILKGVTIGKGAIIGAGSVVTKDVEPWTVNVGNPLRCVQKLTPQNVQ